MAGYPACGNRPSPRVYPVAPHRESALTHARSALDPNALSRCHSAGCRVSFQEHTGMVDLGADGYPDTR